MSLEEATDDDIPKSLKSLLCSLPSDNLNAKELFTIILYVASIESGFTWNIINSEDIDFIHHTFSFDIRRVRSIPVDSYKLWSTVSDHFEKTLYLGGVEDFICKLVANPFSEKIIVHISSAKSLLCFSSIYVIPDNMDRNKPKFEKLKELNMRFRNELFHPIKSYLLTEASIANPSLIGVPLEIISKVSRYLDVKDFLNLCATCKHFYINLSNLESVWVHFSKQYAIGDKPDSLDWKTYFVASIAV